MSSTKVINLLICMLCCLPFTMKGQVGIGTTTPHASSVLDIESSNSGVLLPRISLDSTLDIATISNPETSLLIYNTSTVNDVSAGFYFWENSKWNKLNADEKIFGEIYKNSSSASQALSSNTPIDFGSTVVSEGVVSNSNNFQITTSGYYRVTYSVSILKTAGNPINLGFYLSKGFDASDTVDGSFVHTQLDEFRNISFHMNKIIHLSVNDKIYLFPNITNNNVVIKPDAATMNIELIKAD